MTYNTLPVFILIAGFSLTGTPLLAQAGPSSPSLDSHTASRRGAPGGAEFVAFDDAHSDSDKLVSLLAKTSAQAPKVDMQALYQRKLKMFNGQRYYRAPKLDMAVRTSPPAAGTLAPALAQGGWSAWWVIIIPLFGLAVLFAAIRAGMFDRKSGEDEPHKKKQSRLKVTLSSR